MVGLVHALSVAHIATGTGFSIEEFSLVKGHIYLVELITRNSRNEIVFWFKDKDSFYHISCCSISGVLKILDVIGLFDDFPEDKVYYVKRLVMSNGSLDSNIISKLTDKIYGYAARLLLYRIDNDITVASVLNNDMSRHVNTICFD